MSESRECEPACCVLDQVQQERGVEALVRTETRPFLSKSLQG